METLGRYSIILLGFFSLLLFSQCRKSDRNDEVINPAPHENAIANVVFNDVFRIVHAVSVGDTLMNGRSTQGNTPDACIDKLNYAYAVEQFPNSMVVNFGDDQGVCDLDGRIRNGKFRLDYSGRYGDSLSTIGVEFIGYYVDSLKISGTVSITNRGRNSSNQTVFRMLVTDAAINKDTLDLVWGASRYYTFSQGSATVAYNDDQFEITGNSDGTTSKGNTFAADIIESLVTTFSCNWFSSGVEEVEPTNMVTRNVDYGTNCSSSVSVQYYGTEYEFTLE